MNFARLDHQVKECRTHLDNTGSRNTETETQLVGFLLIRCCAEYEMCLVKIFEARAIKCPDAHITNVAVHWAKKTKSRMNISDLKSHVGTFGSDCKKRFDDFISDPSNKLAESHWASLHANRHLVAHDLPPQATLGDFDVYYANSRGILLGVAESLLLTQTEIAAITWP